MNDPVTTGSRTRRDPRPPSATVGIIGAGQLARMTHQAAISLNIEVRVLTDDLDAPAVRAGAIPVLGTPSSRRDLAELAAGCDVVSFDHELVPPELAAWLSKHALVRPSPVAKLLAQDKLHARRRLTEAGFPAPAFAPVASVEDIEAFAAVHGWPVVVKARSGGYDGRGVWVVDDPREAHALWGASKRELLVEAHADIERELAVLVARTPSGRTAVYPVLETLQDDGICEEVVAPAAVSDEQAEAAQALALRIAQCFDIAGLVAVELFLTQKGLLVNELALRSHNCGHLTIDACSTSQFEQHLRAILDWPLGDTRLIAPAAAMVNLLGKPGGLDPSRHLRHALAVPRARVHLYAKTPRAGRKLGHVTALADTRQEALTHARDAAKALVDG